MFLSVPNTSLAPLRGAPRPADRSRPERISKRFGIARDEQTRGRTISRTQTHQDATGVVYMGLAAHTPPHFENRATSSLDGFRGDDENKVSLQAG